MAHENQEDASSAGGPPHSRLSSHAAEALAAIVQSSDDAVYSKDRAAAITSWNPAAERLYGWSAEEAIGQPIRMIIPDGRRGEELEILDQILAGERVDHYETERVRKDGRLVPVSVSVSPVHDEDGNVVQAAVIARDISAQKELQEVMAERNRKQALELNDEVVQGLAAAKIALETGRHEHGMTAVKGALERAQAIVTELLGSGGPLAPGDLVREHPATLDEGPDEGD